MLPDSARPRLRIADHFIFDAVGIEEIEAAAGFVIAMVDGGEADRLHAHFDRVEIVDLHADMVERFAFGIARVRMRAVGADVERDIGGVTAEMYRAPAIARGAAPTFVPAEYRRQDTGCAIGIADGQIHMFDEGVRHVRLLIRVDAAAYESSSEV